MSDFLKGKDVIIISSSNYNTRSKSRLNVHFISEEIASHGQNVLFVESLGMKDIHLFGFYDIQKTYVRIYRFFKQYFFGPYIPKPNLYVISLIKLPFDKYRWINKINKVILTRTIKKYTKKYLDRKPILWMFLPNLWYLAKAIKNSGIIYHNVDDYTAIPNVDKSYVIKNERKALKVSDLIFTVNSRKINEFAEYTDSDIVYLNNVGNFSLFNKTQTEKDIIPPVRIKKIVELNKPIVGFVGNLAAYKEDVNLLTKIASEGREYSFVIIGSVGDGDNTTNVSKLRVLPNVFFLGPIDYYQLYKYVKYFNVAIIPRRLNAAGEGGFPMKYFEFLASGIPTIVTGVGALKQYSKLARLGGVANNEKTFLKLIKYWTTLKSTNLKEFEKSIKERIKIAKQNSWEKRFVQLNRFVSKIIK